MRNNWGWLLGVMMSVLLTTGLVCAVSPAPIWRYHVPPRWTPQFARGDFDHFARGLPASLGNIPLGISSVAVIERIYGRMQYRARPIPSGERWDLLPETAYGVPPYDSNQIWRIQLSPDRKVVAIAGGWWLMSYGGAVSGGVARDEDGAALSVERVMARAFGPPDSADDFGIGRVLTWDRLPAVIMQVHVETGMAVIATTRNHRLFADE